MDTKKLDKWADLLLDTGKRNNLINFKDTRVSTVEVLLPTADALFEKIDGSASFEVFDPKIIEEDEESEESSETEQRQIEPPEESDISSGKAAFLAQYSGKIKRQNQILLYNSATNPLTAVKNIVKFMPGDVTVETSDKNVATITSGRSRFQINVFPGDEFQQMPIISPDRSFDIPQKVLKNIMNQTAFAISGDDSRPALTGLYFEVTADKLKAVACDTFCLAVRELSVNTNIYSKSGETKIGINLLQCYQVEDCCAGSHHLRHDQILPRSSSRPLRVVFES